MSAPTPANTQTNTPTQTNIPQNKPFELHIIGDVDPNGRVENLNDNNKIFKIDGVDKSSELVLDSKTGALKLNNNAQQSSSAAASPVAANSVPQLPINEIKKILKEYSGRLTEIRDRTKTIISRGVTYSGITIKDISELNNLIKKIDTLLSITDQDAFMQGYENFKTEDGEKMYKFVKKNFLNYNPPILVGGQKQSRKQRKSHKYLYRVRVNSRSKKNRRNNKK
jgi:hypothetical protein